MAEKKVDLIKLRLALQPPIADMAPGEKTDVWGHIFTMQEDRILVTEQPPNVARLELANGRLIRYEPEKIEKVKSRFTDDPTTYYGAGSPEALGKYLGELTIEGINEFCDKNLGVTWPKSVQKGDMVEKTVKAIQDKLGESPDLKNSDEEE